MSLSQRYARVEPATLRARHGDTEIPDTSPEHLTADGFLPGLCAPSSVSTEHLRRREPLTRRSNNPRGNEIHDLMDSVVSMVARFSLRFVRDADDDLVTAIRTTKGSHSDQYTTVTRGLSAWSPDPGEWVTKGDNRVTIEKRVLSPGFDSSDKVKRSRVTEGDNTFLGSLYARIMRARAGWQTLRVWSTWSPDVTRGYR